MTCSTDFGIPQTLQFAPPSSWHFWLRVECASIQNKLHIPLTILAKLRTSAKQLEHRSRLHREYMYTLTKKDLQIDLQSSIIISLYLMKRLIRFLSVKAIIKTSAVPFQGVAVPCACSDWVDVWLPVLRLAASMGSVPIQSASPFGLGQSFGSRY